MFKYLLNIAVSTVAALLEGFFGFIKALHRDDPTLRDNIDCLVKHTVSPVELRALFVDSLWRGVMKTQYLIVSSILETFHHPLQPRNSRAKNRLWHPFNNLNLIIEYITQSNSLPFDSSLLSLVRFRKGTET